MARLDDDYKVALVVPVYNEEETIATFVSTVENKLEPILEHLEIVFVDDGSKDKSAQIIEELMEHNERIALIKLSRNFGKEAAMTAAIDMCDADALIPIDVDLQDPPELVLEFVKIWREQGVDTVYGKRVDRSSDSETKRISSGGFYYVFNKLSGRVKIPENVGDFRLIDSKIIQTVRNLNESNRFMKGLYAWPGFTSCEVDYVRPERSAGTTKWNYWKLWNFALDGIVSFSSLPLRVWSYIGAGVGFLIMAFAASGIISNNGGAENAVSAVASGSAILASPWWLVGSFLFLTLGELCLSPVGLSIMTRIAPKLIKSQVMGLWFVSISVGNVLAGLIGGHANEENLASLPDLFYQCVWILFAVAVVLLILKKFIKKLEN